MINAGFGFLPLHLALASDEIEIETLASFDVIVANLHRTGGVDGDWIYAPTQKRKTLNGVQEMPYPSRVFGLPKTHLITGKNTADVKYLRFHVWALSFFLGIRLTTTDAGFLDATPIRPSKLTDFYLSLNNLPKAVTLSERFGELIRRSQKI